MNTRLHSVDAARALFLLLGIPFHVAIHDRGLLMSPTVAIFASVSHAFRMFAFFMISGYFSALMIQSRARKAWITDRLERIGLPFVVSVLTIGLCVNLLRRYLTDGTLGTSFNLPISIGYLWFLVVLLIYVVILYIVVGKVHVAGGPVSRAIALRGWPGIALIGALGCWGFGRSALDIILRRSELPFSEILSLLFFYAPAFAIGAAAQFTSLKERLFDVARPWHAVVTAGLAFAAVYLGAIARPALGLNAQKTIFEKVIGNAIELPVAFMVSICVFKALKKIVTTKSTVVTFFVDGAMAIYLFHMLWVVLVIYVVSEMSALPSLRWALSSLIVLGLSAGSYVLVRGNVWLSAAYCGTRFPRRLSAR